MRAAAAARAAPSVFASATAASVALCFRSGLTLTPSAPIVWISVTPMKAKNHSYATISSGIAR